MQYLELEMGRISHSSIRVTVFMHKMYFCHLGEQQNTLSSEPDWIQQPVVNHLEATDYEEATVTRYNCCI